MPSSFPLPPLHCRGKIKVLWAAAPPGLGGDKTLSFVFIISILAPAITNLPVHGFISVYL